jgi:hypothetical protein
VRAEVLLLIAGLGACSREARDESRVTADGAGATTRAVGRDTSSAIPVKGPCPATGLWADCSVFERLDRAGLAPQRDSTAVTEAPLTARGQLLRFNRGELEVYVFADAATREREEVRLDREKYAAPSASLGMRPLPTLITSSNLLAILHSRNEHLRERVADALTAGPPQPPASKP